MDTTIIAAIALVGIVGVLIIKIRKGQPRNSSRQTTTDEPVIEKSNKEAPDRDKRVSEYQFFLDVTTCKLSDHDDRLMKHEFSLFNTNAAIIWMAQSDTVTIVCLKEFTNGLATSESYDTFDYNWHKDYWVGSEPKGCKQPVKDVIAKLKIQNNISFGVQDKDEIDEKKNHLVGLMRARYQMEVKTCLFNTEAIIFYTPGKSIAHIVCIERFKKSIAASPHYSLFRYNLKSLSWIEAPPGAAKELEGLVRKNIQE